MSKVKTQKARGCKKVVGRNKRDRNSAMSAYIRGKITFESYQKQNNLKK
jgi:hypothetical protein